MMKRKLDKKDDFKNIKKQKPISKVAGDDVTPKAESLDIQTAREGMLLLGCIVDIRSDSLLMSLPGCLVGTVPITNISNKYTEILKVFENGFSDEVSLHSMFSLGAVFPCKIVKISRSAIKKPTIILSINPEAVNSNLRISLLYDKMVLYSAVVSVEDHGYLMETGISGIKGFLSFENTNSSKLLSIGQVIPTYINKLPNKKNSENVVSLTRLCFEDTFPEISDEDLKISSILPGAQVLAYISEISEPFLYLKCQGFEACASTVIAYKSLKKVKETAQVVGSVLYVHPVTNTIYLHLGALPTPSTFKNYFTCQKYDRVKYVKFAGFHHNKLFFKNKKEIGFVKLADVRKKSSLSPDSLAKNPVLPKARVVFLHYMDNLIQLTVKDALVKMKIVKSDEVKIGDIYEATVKKHVEDGMFVSICPGLSGFVRHIFLSDVYVTKPEKIFPEGSRVKCRVLSNNPSSGMILTCKDSLINLPTSSLLDSYEKAVLDEEFHGVIVKKTKEYIIVLFFNNVQGIISSEDIPKISIFYVGQTIKCYVLHCNSLKKKLKLSLNSKKHIGRNNNTDHIKQQNLLLQPPTPSSTQTDDVEKNDVKDLTARSFAESLCSPTFSERKPYKAVIKKITPHQLNIVVNGTKKGRIHITQMQCSEDGELPFKNFASGQKIKVYVVKEFERRSHNYLAMSHQNLSSFLECSLISPLSVSLGKVFIPASPFVGFLKKVYDTFALVWLSPYHWGKLDFIDVSTNRKTLRKMKKMLKVGQSMIVTVIDHSSLLEDESKEIKLTKPEISAPEIGKNVVGLITVCRTDRKLILKLPHDYIGFVHLTDIQDVFTALPQVLKKILQRKFVLCHVLEVNHDEKTCCLSLRKSRLYCEKFKYVKNASPELSVETIKAGQTVKGYIKSISSSNIIVDVGRNLQGSVLLHSCSKYGCVVCLEVNEAMKAFSVGNVVEVVIKDSNPSNALIPLSLSSLSDISFENATLKVSTDIDWNDLQ